MHVLIVYAHHDPWSFNAALKDTACRTLEECGHTVEVSDLYSMHFNPVTNITDSRSERDSTTHFKYAVEVAKAYSEDKISSDIRAEMDKVSRADLIIFQFPLYWFSMPAILKGWIDRVWVYTWSFTGSARNHQGLMKGKRAMMSMTTGATEKMLTNRGLDGDISVLFWPMQFGMLHYVGFDVLAPEVSYEPAHISAAERKQLLSNWSRRLQNIENEKPLYYIPNKDFIMDKNVPNYGVLKDSFIAENIESRGNSAPTVGQHLGKPLHPDLELKAKRRLLSKMYHWNNGFGYRASHSSDKLSKIVFSEPANEHATRPLQRPVLAGFVVKGLINTGDKVILM